jgi:hypothetical protein
VSLVKVAWVSALHRYGWLLPALLLGIVLPVLTAGFSGNLTIPHNDAWSYSRIARTFGLEGQIQLGSWNRPALVGQIVVLGALARSLLVQQLFVAVLGAVLLLSVFALLRTRVGARAAGLSTLAVACWPGFALLTTSYMADIPMAATALAAVWVGELAIRRDSRWLFAVALLLGFWSCTIRLQAVAAPVALVVWAVLARRQASRLERRTRISRSFAIGAGAVIAALFALFTTWQTSLPNGDLASYDVPADWFSVLISDTVKGFFEAALIGGPVALLAGKPWTWRWPSWCTAGGVAVAGIIAARVFGRDFFLPNYLSQAGAYGVVLPPVRVQFGDSTWWLIIGFAIAMGALLAGALAASRPRVGSVLAVFTILTVLGTAATAVLGQSVFGRYLIPIAPGLFALILHTRPSRSHRAAPTQAVPSSKRLMRGPSVTVGAATLVVTFIISGALASNAWANDRARWNVGAEAAAAGIPADRIDAGFEWMGWFSKRGVIQAHPTSGFGHEGMFSTKPSCVVTVPSPIATDGTAWTLRQEVPYREYLIAGVAHLYVYDTHAPGC